MEFLEVVNTDGITLLINLEKLKVVLMNKDGNACFVLERDYVIETNMSYDVVQDKLPEY